MTDQEFYKILNQSMPDYNVVENIGSGNYGSVYKCERDGIYYAIKIISVPANEKELQTLLARSDKEAVQAYLKAKVEGYRKEIMLMAELKGNRSIVNIEDYKVIESDSGLWYIVIRMELLTSLTLYASKYEMDEEEVIRLGIDICDALSICEKHNIIHRDIKPENIMRHVEGTFKLGDFGVAKQLSKTTAGTIAGTEGFMAPEVYKGQEYNQTADIYSLGIVLYYYLNNKKMPHVDPNDKSLIAEQQAIEKRMTDKAPLPLPPKASKNLGQIVVKACMFDKSCRYRSAADMRADLVKALNGETVTVDFVPASERGTIAQFNEKKTIAQVNDKKGTNIVDTPFTGDIVDKTSEERAKSRNRSTEAFEEQSKPKKKKGVIVGAVAAAAILVAAFIGISNMLDLFPKQDNSQNVTGNELTRAEMEDACALGNLYYEQGNYENAILELGKVTKKSSKYNEAQATIAAAKTAYRDEIIKKSNYYCDDNNFEMALTVLESGLTVVGESSDLIAQQKNVLGKLKLDCIQKSSVAEQNGDYSTAFTYIQTAKAFLPNDAEIDSIYTRLFAMGTMQIALEDAENYYEIGDYANLFATLEIAKNDVSDSTTASSKIKLAYDSYKTSFLKEVQSIIKNPTTVDDYSKAIEALKVAVEIFPNEYELQSKYESLKLMKVAVDAILKAESYYRSSQYKDMFASLKSAMQSVVSDEEAYTKLEDTYEEYRGEYLENLYEDMGELKTIADYDNAIAMLQAALKDLPNDNELKYKLEDMQKYKPVEMMKTSIAASMSFGGDGRLSWCEWENAPCYGIEDERKYRFVYTGDFKDSYNTLRQNALLLRTHNSDSYVTYAIYDCEKFGKLLGNISVYEASKSYAGNLYVEIYGIRDDMTEDLIYRKAFVSGIKPQNVELDVADYSSVKLQIANYDKNGEELYLHTWGDVSGILFSDFVLFK